MCGELKPEGPEGLSIGMEDRSLFAPTMRRLVFHCGQPAPAPHLAHPEGRAALRIVLVTVPRVNRGHRASTITQVNTVA